MTTPPYGHGQYELPPGSAQPPYPAQPAYPTEPALPMPPGYSAYSEPPLQAPYPVSGEPYSPYPPVSAAPVSYGAAPAAPASFGYDPVTGQPYSDKSKVAAGLLQLLPGFLFSLGGIGRLYAGNVGLGVAQLILSLVGWASFWCGFFLIVPFFITFGLWVWFVVDGVMMLAGRPVDGQGRLLRS